MSWLVIEDWLFVKDRAGWPVHLIYVLEALYAVLTVLFALLAGWSQRRRWTLLRDLSTVFGGVSCGLALMWPIALAPLFSNARGEAMLATLPLSLLALPFVIGLFIWMFRSSFAK